MWLDKSHPEKGEIMNWGNFDSYIVTSGLNSKPHDFKPSLTGGFCFVNMERWNYTGICQRNKQTFIYGLLDSFL